MDATDNNSGYITVVSGLPRSGTSMMMQMLAAGGMPILADDLRPPDPDNPRGYFEFDPVKRTRTNPDWATAAVGRAVKLVHLLLPDLPPGFSYRVVFMHRSLEEVIASQAAMLRRLGRRPADLAPQRLAELFAAQIRRVTVWLEQQPQIRTLHVPHRRAIEEPARLARDISAFLEGRLDVARMAAAVDPGLYRHRAGGDSGGGATPPVAGA